MNSLAALRGGFSYRHQNGALIPVINTDLALSPLLQPMASFPQPEKSTNPFDIGSEQNPNQVPTIEKAGTLMYGILIYELINSDFNLNLDSWIYPICFSVRFPSMSSLQGALPSVAPSVSMHLSGLSYPSNAWTLPPSSYVSVLPAQAQTHASAFGPRAYVGQQMPANMGQHIPANIPIPRQEVGSFGVGGAAIGLSNPDQQLTRSSSTNPNPHPFPGGGNPFG
ncbi:hypothetical protein Lal_00002792 [Lupinus albus]|nr:hypothetical protein Lal_00002792 [Lupinus albus]